ncbi:MAG: NADAR family protein [Oscillibacter sp.]|nr:NADAR family protein [Oscillibacter sp.]
MRQIICFHNPDEPNGWLSNWYLSPFASDGLHFSSMEQYMMHRKALCFQDADAAQEILSTDSVGKIKALGRAVRNYDDLIWNGLRQIAVYQGLLEKFRQNEDLRAALLGTGDAVLAECAVRDRIWGIGLSMKDERRFQMEAWRGQNLLGFALMMVRENLQ